MRLFCLLLALAFVSFPALGEPLGPPPQTPLVPEDETGEGLLAETPMGPVESAPGVVVGSLPGKPSERAGQDVSRATEGEVRSERSREPDPQSPIQLAAVHGERAPQGTTQEKAPAPTGSEGEAPPTLKEALGKGEVKFALRYRFETVDEDRFADEGRASTLRSTLSYRTLPYRGFSLFVEAENVTDLGLENEHRNAGGGSLSNGVTDRPTIADPALTEVNQVYLRFARGKTRLDVGRQEVNLGDQRFVGAVGWRQNHQSLDGVRLVTKAGGKVDLTYLFVDRVNRIFGDDLGMASHLLNVGFDTPVGKVTLYGYQLDYDGQGPSVLSTRTLGAELQGERATGWGKVLYEIEYADQSDAGDNPQRVDAGYLFGRLGFAFPKVTVQVGYEVLEGGEGGSRSFSTPLATLHKFNGWADKFLNTPGTGLEDLYLQANGKFGTGNRWAWLAAYHDFAADTVSADYGTELDVQLTYKSPWDVLFGLKAAFYDADTFSTDTDKIWFWSAYTF